MRIAVVAPPLGGHRHAQCLLQAAYDLTSVADVPPPRTAATTVAAWLRDGGFPDGGILHLNHHVAPDLVAALAALDARLVVVLRDPHDLFLALYRDAQTRSGAEPGRRRRADALAGKPLDHPDVLHFLANDLRPPLIRIDEWRRSGLATVLRHEDLDRDPAAALPDWSEGAAPLPAERADRAARRCASKGASVATSRGGQPPVADGEHLGDTHFAIVRDALGDLVAAFGYPLRGDAALAPNPAGPSAAEGDDDLVPPVERMRFRYARKGGREGFADVGARAVRWFAEEANLRPDERVLDVGSGVGRIAVALTKYLSVGARYEGFDVDAEGIAWCRQNITPRFPNFRFQVADVYNKHYHPEGSQPASTYRFPYDDASFDFAFLTSVFTHLLPDDLENYLRQIHRVLAPGGRTFITMFLLNPTTEADIARGASVRTFPYDHDVYRVENDEFPERAIAYHEAFVRDLCQRIGFAIPKPIRAGGWSRRREGGEGHQDVLVAVKQP